ncbi:MAG: hypothetical protein PHG87_01450 [Candidatus Omnitrophica bacterium]|nr:hypothetical protein [Candidatus Omnitrophota bacterium]
MSELKIVKIVFANSPNLWHFVTFNSGEHETEVVGDRHDIDVEVMIPGTEKLENVESIARDKAERFIKELAKTL